MTHKKFLISLLILLNGCAANLYRTSSIKIIGSDTMFVLTSNLAEAYMKEYPGISLHVEGGGTSEGIKALLNNKTDICTASRNLKPEEAKLLADYYGSLGLVFLIAKDGLSIYVNPSNPVKDFNLQQLKDIYTGKISNWRALGGKDTSITTVTRNPNSGTYFYFKEHIMEDENYSSSAIVVATTKEIVNFVSKNTNAIGYGGMGYKGHIFHAKINGIEPNEENVRNDTYPITRYLHFFTTKSPGGVVKNFIDWVLSPAGQNVVRKSGYIPLWENNL
ncbi:MAG: phosphate ABC transporter substrate-binding protein [Ignavibacteriaceae bacterium]|jgi:phosphate transport system substrate-binding protein